MQRPTRFLTLLLLILLSIETESCRKKDDAALVDFTIDLTDPRYSQLSSTGGYVVLTQYNIILARTQSGVIAAVSSLCTYDNSTLTFDPFDNTFKCPSDQSRFDVSGRVQSGYMAKNDLISYHTQLYGNSLRVYS